jgi:predicted transcriptional regulator
LLEKKKIEEGLMERKRGRHVREERRKREIISQHEEREKDKGK